MDLELTDEQTMLSEALTTLLEREWLPAEAAHTATPEQRARLWAALQEFFDADLGAVELCVAARLFGAHLASTPFLGSAALRYAGFAHDERIAIALPVEPPAEVDRIAIIGEDTVALATTELADPQPIDADATRLTAIGALLAAAESVGAAGR